MNEQFILRVLEIAAEWDCYDDLWWRTDSEYAPITFFVNCNDLFFWGSADCEQFTPQNVEAWNQAMTDASKAHRFGAIYGSKLWCARMRECRPQGAAYPEHKELWPLFDACGSERETGFGNPYQPGEYKPKHTAEVEEDS